MSGLEKKTPVEEIEKSVKISVKLLHVNKKPPARKRVFVQTSFYHSNLKLEKKKCQSRKQLNFLLLFLFRRDQITTPI